MFFSKTAALSLITFFAANSAMGAAVPEKQASILIATDPYYACNCPNNCDYKEGTGCRFYSGPSDNDAVSSGTCNYPNGNRLSELTCIP